MRKLAITIAAVAAAASTPSFAATNFFTSFDSVAVAAGSYVILPTVEGWTTNSGAGIEVQNNAAGLPFSAPNFVELDSDNNTVMSRAIDAGVYTLSFYFSPRPNIGAGSNVIDYAVDGVTGGSLTGNGGSNTSWSLYTINFTALAPTRIRFGAGGTSDSFGGYLDDIRLVGSPVPEAATWGMMVLGFGIAGAATRRRRRMVASLV